MKYRSTLLAACLAVSTVTLAQQISFLPTDTYAFGGFDESAAEIVAYDPVTARAFVTNAERDVVVVLELQADGTFVEAFELDPSPYIGGGVNSVATGGGRVAVAVAADPATDPGRIVVYDTDGNFLESHATGALPDAVAFSPDGDYLASADEGEPSDDYDVDPEGSITLVDFTGGKGVSYTVGFGAFVGREDELRAAGVRIYGPGANAAQDLEPEYVTWSPDGSKVYVTLQENNALAVLERATNELRVVPLGYKDHNTFATGFDASNRDEDIEIYERPTLGMYQPDAIKAFAGPGGEVYLATANEGDARDYDGYSEEVRVEDLDLDPEAFPDAAELQRETQLGRLRTTTALGDADGDGDYEAIYSYGARSFSIWDADGELVFDSGDQLEEAIASLYPANFNSNNDDNDSRKSRSDDKGPEPEAIAIGRLGGRTLALIGLERQSAVAVYDVTDPTAPVYLTVFDNRDFSEEAGEGTGGDLGPEDIVFVEAADSPTGEPVVLVSNEVSGTLTAYRVARAEERFTLQILHNNDGESELLQDENVGAGGISAFAVVVDSLRYTGYLNNAATVLLSSGDNFLPGPAFTAGRAAEEIYDAIAVRELGYDALAIGNHDFDFGPDVLARFVREATDEPDPAIFLSANLDFAAEPELAALVAAERIAPSTILYRGDERIGIIGLTTPELRSISSPGAVAIDTNLASLVNAQVDRLAARGVDKFVLVSHLQGLSQDTALIPRLRGIDVVIAGGGDELLTNDPNDTLPGGSVGGPYPLGVADADGRTVYVVTTPGSYRYLGQLYVTFDDAGEVVAIGEESGPVKVSTQRPGPAWAQAIEAAVSDYVASLGERDLATTDVALDGLRANVRTSETNQGNLIADALLFQARALAADFGVRAPTVALQNGGGIRNDAIIPAGATLTELTTFDILPFSNFVSVVEAVSPVQLKRVLENAVSRVEDVSGRFAQVAGLSFSYDPTAPAQVLDDGGAVLAPGSRVVDVVLDDGTPIVLAGAVASGAPDVSLATIDFLARGGDQYPLGEAFTSLGVTYQQALANYLAEGLGSAVTARDYPAGGKGRITALAGGAVASRRTSVDSEPAINAVVARGPKGSASTHVSVFPNPARDFLVLRGERALGGALTVMLLDATGRTVVSTTRAGEAGPWREGLSLVDVPPGSYTLVVSEGSGTTAQSLVVRR